MLAGQFNLQIQIDPAAASAYGITGVVAAVTRGYDVIVPFPSGEPPGEKPLGGLFEVTVVE